MLTHISIPHIQGHVLFSGYYASLADCAADATSRQISLAGADLAFCNLQAAELDDADLRGARLSGANLNGANISEAQLSECDFTHASLADTCLTYSDLSRSYLLHCRFGATDITGTCLQDCYLAGPETFRLPLADCANMSGCVYIDEDGTFHTMDRPPIVITGLPHRLVIMDNGIKRGAGLITPFHDLVQQDAEYKSITPPAG